MSHNFSVNLQTHGAFLEKRTWSPNRSAQDSGVASFPNVHSIIDNYEIRARSDRDKHGGLIEFVRKALLYKKLRKYESLNIEVICSKVTISNKNWAIAST